MVKTAVNDIKRGPIANCIVLHDFSEQEPDIKGWFEYTKAFFEKHGLTPTKAAISGPNGTKGPNNTTFKYTEKKLYECDFKGIEGIWFGAPPPDCSQEELDSIFNTHLNIRIDKKNKTLVLCFDDQIVPFTRDIMNQLACDLSAFFKPLYGYCYQRPFKKGPKWYPFGTCVGIDYGDPEGDLLTKWANAYHMSDGKYKTGDLRDIYPMNLLSKAHQEHIVEGKPFFDWIKADPHRDDLVPLNDDLWAWWVELENIPVVREALRPTGWVICI